MRLMKLLVILVWNMTVVLAADEETM